MGAPLVQPGPSAAADGAPGYGTSILAEAWYRAGAQNLPPLDGCGVPVAGCLPLPDVTVPSQYPGQTLHVGVAGGTEESRTYLTFASSGVPIGAEVVGGTLMLPLATDAQAGTLLPETAAFRACLVTAPIKNGVEGGLGGAPAVDCTVSAPARYHAASASTGALFTVDLAPFAKTLSLGQLSVGLVPADVPGTAWHVAFSRSDRQGAGVRPITATLRVAAAEVTPFPTDSTPTVPSDSVGQPVSPRLEPGMEIAPLPPSRVDSPQIASNGASTSASGAAVPVSVLSGSSAPAGVLLLPLLLAAGVGWASRLFTRELLPVRD